MNVSFKRSCRLANLFALLFSFAPIVHAQWMTQTIELKAGWNAVFLFVQPEPDECDSVFSGMPIERVQAYKDSFSTIQFIQNPEEIIDSKEKWLIWYPNNKGPGFLKSLFSISGGKPYFIKTTLNPGESYTWNLKGKALPVQIEWKEKQFNLVGYQFGGGSGSLPTFADFFGQTTTFGSTSTMKIYRMSQGSGTWERIWEPQNTPMASGEAFWIYMYEYNQVQEPLTVTTDQAEGLNYGSDLLQQKVTISNNSTMVKSVSVTLRDSENVSPEVGESLNAGPVPLYYTSGAELVNLQEYPIEKNLNPTEKLSITFFVERSKMKAVTSDYLYQSILKVQDKNGGFFKNIPVLANGPQTAGTDGEQRNRFAGLWVGTATINKVGYPGGDISDPVETPYPFEFRLIIHIDNPGKVKLLQKVYQMWKEGTTTEDPNNALQTISDQPGKYVIYSNQDAIPEIMTVGRRISSSAFGFTQPVNMILTGGTNEFNANSELKCDIEMPYDSGLNPFLHPYHPDHDNLTDDHSAIQPETFAISRSLDLQFKDKSASSDSIPGWGDKTIGGDYSEAITIWKLDSNCEKDQKGFRTVQIKGSFKLDKICDSGELISEKN